ncbi:MAG: DegT/DnrJ/EryC1/StrS family aminotransferase [Candidatus Aminicenantes bacterium]|nr:DegT/DnrJ/EryC1/StrS family aminotransferase [Candidatus Aminicenantes bacterium]
MSSPFRTASKLNPPPPDSAAQEPVPLLDLKRQTRLLEPRITAAMREVLDSGEFILGPAVVRLEERMARYCQCRYAVAVASGTDALRLTLSALGIGPGDEVITTPFSFVATAGTILRCGATPVFADIDPGSYNLDPDRIESAITSRTRAILPVHLYGQPADMDPIRDLATERGLRLIEDCAQAVGARYGGAVVGSLGDAGCLSFFPTKNLGAFGDAGMIVTGNADFGERLALLRNQGNRRKHRADVLGFNSRMDTLQAAILEVKLDSLEDWNSQRRAIARRYNRWLEETPVKTPPESRRGRHVYNVYTLRAPRRDQLANRLAGRGIGNAVYYPVPLHLQGAFSRLGHTPGSLPAAETASREVISLPIFPELTREQQRRVCEEIYDFYRN